MHACVCVHVKILANMSSLIEQNIDRFGDGEKMGKNIVSFWRIKVSALCIQRLASSRVHMRAQTPPATPTTASLYRARAKESIYFLIMEQNLF